jgi:hypothetical protein
MGNGGTRVYLPNRVRTSREFDGDPKSLRIPISTHFSPLVGTIGIKKPVVKREIEIFSL